MPGVYSPVFGRSLSGMAADEIEHDSIELPIGIHRSASSLPDPPQRLLLQSVHPNPSPCLPTTSSALYLLPVYNKSSSFCQYYCRNCYYYCTTTTTTVVVVVHRFWQLSCDAHFSFVFLSCPTNSNVYSLIFAQSLRAWGCNQATARPRKIVHYEL